MPLVLTSEEANALLVLARSSSFCGGPGTALLDRLQKRLDTPDTRWSPPVKDPAFARWVSDLLGQNYGPPLDPHETVDQLTGATGYTSEELCELFDLPADYYDNPEGDEGESEGF